MMVATAMPGALVLALALALAPAWLTAADEVDKTAAEAAPPGASDGPQIITPTSEQPRRTGKDGPAVELITGGNSTDGAARVGSLPVLD